MHATIVDLLVGAGLTAITAGVGLMCAVLARAIWRDSSVERAERLVLAGLFVVPTVCALGMAIGIAHEAFTPTPQTIECRAGASAHRETITHRILIGGVWHSLPVDHCFCGRDDMGAADACVNAP